MLKISKKLKIVQISINFCFVFSERLFVSSYRRRGGGGEWVTVRKGGRGGGNSGWSTVDGSSTSTNLPSHHKYKSPKQFELKQSLKAARALNARWALPVYPIFEDEKSKASEEKSVKRIKKDRHD